MKEKRDTLLVIILAVLLALLFVPLISAVNQILLALFLHVVY